MWARSLASLLLVFGYGCASGRAPGGHDNTGQAAAERECVKKGWQKVVLNVQGLERHLYWKAPPVSWRYGAIIVLHGGGGRADHWCARSIDIVNPQVDFSELAVKEGFAVLSLDSSDSVTDDEGRICGKVWDDQSRNRPNLDLPFLNEVLLKTIPSLRPPGGSEGIFLTGLSSGGYMTVRAATHFSRLIQAFAPVSSGDPYGWHRICKKELIGRRNVFGRGYDNETGKEIMQSDSCKADAYMHERPWDAEDSSKKRPVFRLFHHKRDGVNDLSCNDKVQKQLVAHGFREVERYLIQDSGRRRLMHHLWQGEYNQPILDFFKSVQASSQANPE